MPGNRTRWVVAVTDGQRLFAELLHSALVEDPELEGDGLVEATAMPAAVGVDVVALPLDEVHVDAVRLIGLVRDRWAPAAVMVVATRPDELGRRRAFNAGADGWVPSTARLAEIRGAIARAGRRAHPGAAVLAGAAASAAVAVATAPVPEPRLIEVSLTARERDVLEHLARGHTARVAARLLGISDQTCRGHLKHLLAKLGAHSQLQALAIARRDGLLPT